ncbi:MAG: ATP-binding protein [Pseudomonadota bacterium]
MAHELYDGYEAEIRQYRLAFSRGCAYAAIALILVGAALDYNLYPAMQLQFAAARTLVAVLVLAVLQLMRTPWGQDRAVTLTFVWLLLPQTMITWMISRTEGASSLYYAGLHLAIFASGIALPFSMRQNIAFGAVSYVMYVLACSVHQNTFELRGAFIVNSLFLLMSATVSAVCTFFNERARFTLFRLKAEVADTNRQLEQTNHDLAEIKGQMLQQEKMAAIGTLAAGLLHEVNNPVNFCMMAIDIAIEEPAAKASALVSECLFDAKQGMQRVQYIVSDLKTFAYRKSGSEDEGTPFLFEKALASAIRLIGHEIKGIPVQRELPSDTLVRGDEAAIIGVLINLLGNAVLAMRKAQRAVCAIDISAVWEAERLRVTVRDNGHGIAPANLTRVFEPFFTTREVGQGLGLGLSISYGVIKRHGGTLMAESAQGEWTKMIFDLARAA